MQQVNIHEAKTNLSKLIERAVRVEPFVIAKSAGVQGIVVAGEVLRKKVSGE